MTVKILITLEVTLHAVYINDMSVKYDFIRQKRRRHVKAQNILSSGSVPLKHRAKRAFRSRINSEREGIRIKLAASGNIFKCERTANIAL